MNLNIRNFAIIAHIDHGKSTLSDRFLEITGTVSKKQLKEQFLDQNPISRERGITIKLSPVRMEYVLKSTTSSMGTMGEKARDTRDTFDTRDTSGTFILNLIDTPGHVDFSYEVSRSLAACEGAILLVDATQGIQAQTVAHFNTAKKEGLRVIPVINKIDLPIARLNEVENQFKEIFGIYKEEIIHISAKTGENVDLLLKEVIKRIPPPQNNYNKPLRALIFDAIYDEHRGVIVYVRIVDGRLGRGEKILFLQTNKIASAVELGYFAPFRTPQNEFSTGDIGYIVTSVKDIKKTQVGDTIIAQSSKLKTQSSEIEPLPGYKKPKPMVFFGVYPRTTQEYIKLKEALERYALNDTSISVSAEYSSFLGSGFRVGFLGLLHADIVKQRLKEEENIDLLLTSPQVLYEIKEDGEIFEPFMTLTIYTPSSYVGQVITLCQKNFGKLINITYFQNSAILKYDMPYSTLIRGLASELKSATSGFASIDYELTSYRQANLVKLDIKINDQPIDVLSEYVYKDEAVYKGREKTEKLKSILPKKQIKQVIQAVIGGSILARAEITPFRKDVTAKLYGGDRTRKDKLLEAQKKGKSKMLEVAKIDIPQEALFSFIEK